MENALQGMSSSNHRHRRRDYGPQRGHLFSSVQRILRLAAPTLRNVEGTRPSPVELVVQSLEALNAFHADVSGAATDKSLSRRSSPIVVVASSSSVASLADTAAASSSNSHNLFPSADTPGHHQMDASERASANCYASAVQAVVYAAFACSRRAFSVHQRSIAMALVHRAPVVHAAAASAPRSLAPLHALLHQSAADGYMSLLLRHNVAPMSAYDFHALVRALAMRRSNAAVTATAEPSAAWDVCPLPVGPAYPHVHASWMHSVALLSWAHSMPQELSSRSVIRIEQRNVVDVVASVVFHLGTRQAAPPVTAATAAVTTQMSLEHQQILERLQQLVQRNNAGRSDGGSDGDAPEARQGNHFVAIQGKKVELVEAAQTADDRAMRVDTATVSTHLASEFLIEGRWEAVLASFARLSAASADPSEHQPVDAPPMHRWAFYRAYLHSRRPHDARHRQALEHIVAASKCGAAAAAATPSAMPTHAAVDDRIRAYLLHHVVPHYAPKALVGFEGHGRRTIAYMLRSRLWEFLPFACAAAASSGHPETMDALRQRLVVPLYRLQQHHRWGDGGDGLSMPPIRGAWSHTYQALGDLLVHHTTTLLSLMVPSLTVHRQVLLTLYRPWWLPQEHDVMLLCSGAAAASLDPECPLTPAPVNGMASTAPLLTLHSRRVVEHAANSMDNFWLSCWLECLCTMGPVGRVHRLMGALSRHHSMACVVSPECAAAIATSITLRALRCQSTMAAGTINADVPGTPPSRTADEEAIQRTIQDSLPRQIYFVVPEDKTPAHYFKWLQSSAFYYRMASTGDDGAAVERRGNEDPAAPNGAAHGCTPWVIAARAWGSPLGLLGGRCYRLATHMPNIATKQQQQTANNRQSQSVETRHRSEGVRMHVWVLDVAAIAAAALQGSAPPSPPAETLALASVPGGVETAHAFLSESSCGERGARGLVDMVALYKPAGLATTLHSGTASVASFLAGSGGVAYPWIAPGHDFVQRGANGHDTIDSDASSVLAQEGLINRIDRATSGIVLAARSEMRLFEQRRANLAERQTAKVYYAIVVHVPPTDRAVACGADIWTPGGSGAFFLPPKGVIGGEVFAEGSFYSQRISHQYSKARQLPIAAPSAAQSAPPSSRSFLGTDQREASTEYSVVEHFPSQGIYLVRVVLRSGRRHQIRQHFASIHHPLLGDVKYHPRAAHPWMQRAALHAAEVDVFRGTPSTTRPSRDDNGVVAPSSGAVGSAGDQGNALESFLTAQRRVVVSCDLPEDMHRVLRALRSEEHRCERRDRKVGAPQSKPSH